MSFNRIRNSIWMNTHGLNSHQSIILQARWKWKCLLWTSIYTHADKECANERERERERERLNGLTQRNRISNRSLILWVWICWGFALKFFHLFSIYNILVFTVWVGWEHDNRFLLMYHSFCSIWNEFNPTFTRSH